MNFEDTEKIEFLEDLMSSRDMEIHRLQKQLKNNTLALDSLRRIVFLSFRYLVRLIIRFKNFALSTIPTRLLDTRVISMDQLSKLDNKDDVIYVLNSKGLQYADLRKKSLSQKVKLLIHPSESDIDKLKQLSYNFQNAGSGRNSNSQQRIVYVVNRLSLSGGMQIIVTQANLLYKRGYDVSIYSFDDYIPSEWLKIEVPVFSKQDTQIFPHLLENVDVLIATHWSTALEVDRLNSKRKLYFIQSDERRFHLNRKFTENLINLISYTYTLDFEFYTEAKWIQKWLKNEFQKDAYFVPNGFEADLFKPAEPEFKKSDKMRVLLEGPINFWLKNMNNAYKAVDGLDVEIWVVSGDGVPPESWKIDRFFEKVSFTDMPKIYSSCDILVKMTLVEGFFGPPMEAMACGCCAVVSEVTGVEEYMIHNENSLISDFNDIDGVRKNVEKLINDSELRKKLIVNGKKVIHQWTWENSIDQLEKVLRREPVGIYYDTQTPDYSFDIERMRILKAIKK